VKPYSVDVGDAGVFERVPDKRRAEYATVKALPDRRAQRRLATDERLIAMIERFDADDGLTSERAGMGKPVLGPCTT
jgi:hypothetical protein